MKELKLKRLEEGFESGAISNEEYEKKKKEIEEMPEEKVEEREEEVKETKSKSDKILLVGIILIIVIFVAIFIGFGLFKQKLPKTIEELHQLNLQGKLKPEQGYLYKDVYSFVKYNDFWYWQLPSQSGKTEFNFNFRYSPRELEDIQIKGWLDVEKFNNASQYYATFNPLGDELSHIRLARLDYDLQMTRVFQKTPVSACDRNVSNVTTDCSEVPIITCENTEDIVIYFKEADELSVEYKDNCIIIEGREFDFVKGVNRILYNLYEIMEQ